MKKIAITLFLFVLYAFTTLTNGSMDLTYVKLNSDFKPDQFIQEHHTAATLYDREFTGFKEAIAFKESRNNYYRVNSMGYLGKYQFGVSTLKLLRIYNTKAFLYNPELQEKAFYHYCSYNKWILRDIINNYSGKTIKGIKITESGILAAAHLAGAGSVQKFFRSNGKGKTIIDAYGTTIEYYLKEFAGYDLSSLPASASPVVK